MGRGTDHARHLRGLLIAERDRKGWSLEQVARAVARELDVEHVPKQTIHGWESFRTHPRIDQFAAWARALGMRLEADLVRESDEEVVIRLPRALASPVRDLTLLSNEDRAAIVHLVDRLTSSDQKSST